MANKKRKRTNGSSIKTKEKARLNRLVSAAASRAGATRQEISGIQRSLWQIREIVSRDRESGVIGAASSIAGDIGPEYAIAAINRLELMDIIGEREAAKAIKDIGKKYPGSVDKANKLQNRFNQAADVFWETGIGLVGPKGRRIGLNANGGRSLFDEIEAENESTGKTVNKSIESLLMDYYQSIGIPADMDPELMPVQGYVVHRDHDKKRRQMSILSGAGNVEMDGVYEIGDEDIAGDGLTADGEIEIVLKPGVSGRTSYGLGRGMDSHVAPVKLNSTNKDDVMDALTNITGKRGPQESMDAMLNLLAASIDSDFADVNSEMSEDGKMRRTNQFDDTKRRRKPMQAQILGGFDVDEIEQINYPFTKLEKKAIDENIDDVVNSEMIRNTLLLNGFNQEEIDYITSTGMSKLMDTESMKMLRNYRYAQKLREMYREQGVKKFKIAHPLGINIDNPMSHSKAATPDMGVEQVLVENIKNELKEVAQKLMKDIRKPGTPTLISRRGNRL